MTVINKMIRLLELTSAALAIIGSRYIKRKNELGFVFWTIANVMWISYTIITQQFFMMVMYFVFIYYTLTSPYSWRNGEDEFVNNGKADKGRRIE